MDALFVWAYSFIHCLELFSVPKTQISILRDLSACSQSSYLMVNIIYFNICRPFPDTCNGNTQVYFNSLLHYAKTLKIIWKSFVLTEVNKEHLFSQVSVRKCWEQAQSASADTVWDDSLPIPTFLVSTGQTQRIPLIVWYLAKQTKGKWVNVTCSHVTKIQKIETSTIWEICKASDICHEKHLQSLEYNLSAKGWPGLSLLNACVSYPVTE